MSEQVLYGDPVFSPLHKGKGKVGTAKGKGKGKGKAKGKIESYTKMSELEKRWQNFHDNQPTKGLPSFFAPRKTKQVLLRRAQKQKEELELKMYFRAWNFFAMDRLCRRIGRDEIKKEKIAITYLLEDELMHHRVRRWQEYGCLVISSRTKLAWMQVNCWTMWKLYVSEMRTGTIARRNLGIAAKGQAIATLTSNFSFFGASMEMKRKVFQGWLGALLETRFQLLSEMRDAERKRVHENMSRARFQQMRAEVILLERTAIAETVAAKWHTRAVMRKAYAHWLMLMGGAIGGGEGGFAGPDKSLILRRL